MRKLGSTVLALGGLWLARAAHAQSEPAPGLDFLEYLGSWQADDDEWLAIVEWDKDNGKGADVEDGDDDDAQDDGDDNTPPPPEPQRNER